MTRAVLHAVPFWLAASCCFPPARAATIDVHGVMNGDIDRAETTWTFFQRFP
ncbi:hypothetical protein [Bradyrhizobium sp. Ghvi]|uniref:hypothetical protein n=1 Tax=Bradyrhizobium sp. Ghvi TaxID=1855319 RepID=UPI0015A536DA|nr:hypothetical protein [Bradyrhizobium sp. Ghvi]